MRAGRVSRDRALRAERGVKDYGGKDSGDAGSHAVGDGGVVSLARAEV